MKKLTIIEKLDRLLETEDRKPAITSLALRLKVSENYVRMLHAGLEPGGRIEREVDALYKRKRFTRSRRRLRRVKP